MLRLGVCERAHREDEDVIVTACDLCRVMRERELKKHRQCVRGPETGCERLWETGTKGCEVSDLGRSARNEAMAGRPNIYITVLCCSYGCVLQACNVDGSEDETQN
eukprot:3751682-Rhodomonas_salina.5